RLRERVPLRGPSAGGAAVARSRRTRDLPGVLLEDPVPRAARGLSRAAARAGPAVPGREMGGGPLLRATLPRSAGRPEPQRAVRALSAPRGCPQRGTPADAHRGAARMLRPPRGDRGREHRRASRGLAERRAVAGSRRADRPGGPSRGGDLLGGAVLPRAAAARRPALWLG